MSIADHLRRFNQLVPPNELFAGICTEGAGEPDSNTSPFYLFYIDTDTDTVYFKGNAVADDWESLTQDA